MSDGTGALGLELTVVAGLTSGEETSFTFSVISDGACLPLEPTLTDQKYFLASPAAGYDAPYFTVSA